jgi:hypothetical protein
MKRKRHGKEGGQGRMMGFKIKIKKGGKHQQQVGVTSSQAKVNEDPRLPYGNSNTRYLLTVPLDL